MVYELAEINVGGGRLGYRVCDDLAAIICDDVPAIVRVGSVKLRRLERAGYDKSAHMQESLPILPGVFSR